MSKLIIFLNDEERAELARIALEERRDVGDQAAYLVVRELRRRQGEVKPRELAPA